MSSGTGLSIAEGRPRPAPWLVLGTFPVQTVALVGACMPGIGCYMVIAYTYIFQFDRVLNFSAAGCPNVTSSFPPVSYSIGVWEPQRFCWLFVVFGHIPARLFMGHIYAQLFLSSDTVHASTIWYRFLASSYTILMMVEGFGLISVSIVDIDASFVLHAFFYTLWLVSFNLNMLFNTTLILFSGFIYHSRKITRIYFVKLAMLCIGVPLSISTGFTYPHYMAVCSSWAYTMFSVVEYILVGWNSLFHFFCFWELPTVKLKLHANFEKYYDEEKHVSKMDCVPARIAAEEGYTKDFFNDSL